MKNATALFLLFIFSFNLVGSYAILKIQQFQIRREVKQQIKLGVSENELTSITISAENQQQLTWKEDGKEFSYKGAMYDVVRTEIIDENLPNGQAGKKIYHCISDSQETRLIAKYNKELQKKRKNKNNRTNSIKVLKFIEKINPLPQKQDLAFIQKEVVANFAYYDNYTPLSLEISSPPPKQFL